MGNKAENVIDQIKKQCNEDFSNSLFRKLGNLEEKPTPKKQGDYIKACITEINCALGSEVNEKIMRSCGHCCISNGIIDKAKKLYQQADEQLEEFLNLLNQNDIGGGQLHIENGKIIGIYSKCYCRVPQAIKEMPKEYCECSAGWVEKLFLSAFEKDVLVEIKQTIISGSDSCVFEIQI